MIDIRPAAKSDEAALGRLGAALMRQDSISTFASPNVVHFCAALLVAAILSAPWSTLRYAGVAVAGCGVLGVVYSVVVLRRARRQREYRPVLEDCSAGGSPGPRANHA